jgi:NADH-ubiquinone oxidoreductase chain 5
MEGPTPVSALIHAATMVTAGVFLIIRCSALFEFSPKVLFFIAIIGSITAVFASLVGLVQNDVKKTVAYSTCSQLGYMIFSCGLSNYMGAGFHLVNHAFFKALLFLSAGVLIHSMGGDQDLRKYGALINLLPLTYVMFLIGSLALIGFPFLSGFYSKDMLIASAYYNKNIFVFNLGMLSAFFTSFYSFRILFLTFFGFANSYKSSLNLIHKTSLQMWLPLLFLAFGSIFFGYFSKDIFIGLGSNFFGDSIFILPSNVNKSFEYIPCMLFKFLPLICSALGGLLAYGLNAGFNNFILMTTRSIVQPKSTISVWLGLIQNYIANLYIILNKFLSSKGYFDYIYNSFLLKRLLIGSFEYIFEIVDKGFLEIFGPYGISNLILFYAKKLYRFHTGNLYQYTFLTVIGFLLFLFIHMFTFIF